MKKLYFAAVALAAMSGINATAQESYAPEAGDFSTEIQFNPLSAKDYTFKIDALEGRYFVTDNDAVTLGIGIAGKNHKDVPDTGNDDAFTKYYNGYFSIDLGYQRHFFNYKRIDLYAGAKIGYVCHFAGNTVQVDNDNKVKQTNYDGNGYYGSNGFRIKAFTGIDFYIYKGLYLGAEIGIGLDDNFASKVKTSTTVAGVTVTNKGTNGGHDFNISTYVSPLIRLGWTF